MPKISFDTASKEILITAVPDSDGVIDFDVQVDLYSDGKEMWLADAALKKFDFPVLAQGGNITAAGVRGTLYTLIAPWKIRMPDYDHEFRYTGALVASDGTRVWVKPSGGDFSVAVIPATPDNIVFLKPNDPDLTDDLNRLIPYILGSARFWGVQDEGDTPI